MSLDSINHIYEVSSKTNSLIKINQHTQYLMKTLSCYNNMDIYELTSENNNKLVNPVNNPLFINGIFPNDVVRISIEKIDIDKIGIMYSGEKIGLLSNCLCEEEYKSLDIKNDIIIFNDINIKLEKMIGIIGLLPSKGVYSTSTPAEHGGNIDCRLINEGCNVYLKANTHGGGLYIGDVHAQMADGEIGGTGLEVSAEVSFMCDKISFPFPVNMPLISSNEGLFLVSSHSSLEQAIDNGLQQVKDILISITKFSINDVVKLMSLICDVEINQLVNDNKSIRIKIPHYILHQYNIYL